MSQFSVETNPVTLAKLGATLERLNKSFAAGHQGLSNLGRTGVSALAGQQLDPMVRSITIEGKNFLLTKDIKTIDATQTVYEYIVKTEVGTEQDLAGFESFLPQEQAAQYLRVGEVLKVYGVKKSITQMAQLVNEAGGYALDIEAENDKNAALSMANQMERDLYTGGDDFLAYDGDIDPLLAANRNASVRHIRGIQANVTEGDMSQRGIPGDFEWYGNNRSVVFDRKGAAMTQDFVDTVVTAVNDSNGAVSEAHCTSSQLKVFRSTLFPIERGDISSHYAVNSSNVSNDEQVRWPMMTIAGKLDFIATPFKYRPSTPKVVVGTSGVAPSTPTITTALAGSTVIGAGSGFTAGQVYSYRVQACSVHGRSAPSTASIVTVAAPDADKPIQLTIAAQTGVEYFMIYRSPVQTSGRPMTERYLGKVAANRFGATIMTDNNKLLPGLDALLFLPADKKRAQVVKLGNLLNKLQLGVQGTGFETIYTSYFACVVDQPRTFALARNVLQEIQGIPTAPAV